MASPQSLREDQYQLSRHTLVVMVRKLIALHVRRSMRHRVVSFKKLYAALDSTVTRFLHCIVFTSIFKAKALSIATSYPFCIFHIFSNRIGSFPLAKQNVYVHESSAFFDSSKSTRGFWKGFALVLPNISTRMSSKDQATFQVFRKGGAHFIFRHQTLFAEHFYLNLP